MESGNVVRSCSNVVEGSWIECPLMLPLMLFCIPSSVNFILSYKSWLLYSSYAFKECERGFLREFSRALVFSRYLASAIPERCPLGACDLLRCMNLIT